jgi:hypothetical protein
MRGNVPHNEPHQKPIDVKTILVTPFDLFYSAFVKSSVLHEYKPQLHIAVCGFCADTVENKLYCNTLKDKGIDVSHVYFIKKGADETKHEFSLDDWDFICSHDVIETDSSGSKYPELVKRKQPHQFMGVLFTHFSQNDFSQLEGAADVLYARVSNDFLREHQDTILAKNATTFLARTMPDNNIHVFQGNKTLSMQPYEEIGEEYFMGYRTIFTNMFYETKNIALAKYYANSVTRSILNTIDWERFHNFRNL